MTPNDNQVALPELPVPALNRVTHIHPAYYTAAQLRAYATEAVRLNQTEPAYDLELIARMLETCESCDYTRAELLEQATLLRAAAAGVRTASIAPAEAKGDVPERCGECRHTTFERRHDGSHICVHCKTITPQPAGVEAVFYAPPRLVENCHAISGVQKQHRVVLSTEPDETYSVPFYTTPPAAQDTDLTGGWDAVAFANLRDAVTEWKRRALDAEATIQRLTDEFNAENGPTHMGEPVLPAAQAQQEAVGSVLAEWFAKEMPAGTVIGDPDWWSGKLARHLRLRKLVHAIGAEAAHPAADALGAVRELVAKWRKWAAATDGDRYEEGWSEAICGAADELESALAQAPAVQQFPPAAFETWFADVEAGDGTIPVPQSAADGDAWHKYIGRRQVALGAWIAAMEACAGTKPNHAECCANAGGDPKVCDCVNPRHVYLPEAPAVQVTDEMVRQARTAACNWDADSHVSRHAMRAALEAALGQGKANG